MNLEEIARRTDGFSCADLRSLCREAAMQPVRRLLKGLSPGVTQETIECTIVSAGNLEKFSSVV